MQDCPHVNTVGHHVWMQRGSGAVCCGGCYLSVNEYIAELEWKLGTTLLELHTAQGRIANLEAACKDAARTYPSRVPFSWRDEDHCGICDATVKTCDVSSTTECDPSYGDKPCPGHILRAAIKEGPCT